MLFHLSDVYFKIESLVDLRTLANLLLQILPRIDRCGTDVL